MNILLINHYAGSPELGMEFRPYYMARQWVKSGHHVLIVGATYSHLRRKQPSEGGQNIDGVDYYWVKTNKYHGNGLGRIYSMFLFVFKLMFLMFRIYSQFRPEIVIASSTYPMDIYPARKIAKKYGAKLIYEVHDLWPLSPMELGGYSKYHPFIRIIQWAEDYAYKHVDAVVSMLPKAFEHMIAHGLLRSKFHYIPNGVVVEDWQFPGELEKEHGEVLKQMRTKNKFIVGFAGAHGIANSLQTVINAVAELNDRNVVLMLVGTGQEKENLIKYVKNQNIVNVHFLPPVNKEMIPSLLKEMDVLYIGLQKQSLFRFGISPNKMFDYMMAKKPIIQAIEAGNNLVEEAGCGINVEPDNVMEIKNAIRQLQDMSAEERSLLGENGYKFVMLNHTYNVLADKFLNIMNNLIK